MMKKEYCFLFSLQLIFLFSLNSINYCEGFFLPPPTSTTTKKLSSSSSTTTKRRKSLFLLRTTSTSTNNNINNVKQKKDVEEYLILWRGEGVKDYSIKLRTLEFCSSLASITGTKPKPCSYKMDQDKTDDEFLLGSTSQIFPIEFQDALQINKNKNNENDDEDNLEESSALQYLISSSQEDGQKLTDETITKATQRCSLVRATYKILARGESYEEVAQKILQKFSSLNNNNNIFTNLLQSSSSSTSSPIHKDSSWCIRLRQYNSTQKRYGKRIRSPLTQERQAILEMKDLIQHFTGPVDLMNPDVKLYLFDMQEDQEGEQTKKNILFAIELAQGSTYHTLAPNTRICVTTTPLDPIASILLCNVAQIPYYHDPNNLSSTSTLTSSNKNSFSILDPYAGSCSILLGAASIPNSPSTQNNKTIINSVGIEIAPKTDVDFDLIEKDFETRNLTLPSLLLRGDSIKNVTIREQAKRRAAQGEAFFSGFDAIITDPPYGIREKLESDPLIDLIHVIIKDLQDGKPLLDPSNGVLVAFIPVTCSNNNENEDNGSEGEGGQKMKRESIHEKLPSTSLLERAGLKFVIAREQVLSSILSRWIVMFKASCDDDPN